ncbi:MAG: efflux RND transporter periplasmic adaptor subunit [Deltaproteobacteria bacterium]|nr:efflux RND transporter periplasmic adaptor subunit [Deltaproteobacteria bacterium]
MTDQLSQDLASLKIDRNAPPRRSLGGLLVIALIILGVGAVGVFVIYPKVSGALGGAGEVKTDEIRMVSPAQGSVQLSASGNVVALIYAKVAAKVPGRIAEIYVEEGQKIEKDAKVARLEDVDFKSGLASSRARAASSRARIAIARANVAELKVQIERERPLVEKGVTAKATLDDLVAKSDSLLASVRSAEAEAAASDAETRSLDVQLGSYLITSPISGTVVDKLVEVGEGVSPGFGTPGVVEVVDMSSLVVEVDVPESRISQIEVGAPAEILLDAYPANRLAGTVKEIGKRINKSKATVPIKVRFEQPPDQIVIKGAGSGADKPMLVLPDMAARVSFLGAKLDAKSLEQPPKRVVPTRAVVKRNNADVVFIVDGGAVRMVSVTTKGEYGGGLELETNLPERTKVVLDPPADLADGNKVKEKK